MKLKTLCPHCKASLSVKIELVGRTARCPRCQTPFVIEDVRSPSSDHSLEQSPEARESSIDARAGQPQRSDSSNDSIGRFEIRQKLGEGGFGTVYRAYDPVLNREIALKLPHSKQMDGGQSEQLLKEAQAAARLRHPNIVAVFEVGTSDQQPYIAAEFVAGRTFSELIKESKSEKKQMVEWLIAVSRGLAHAIAKESFTEMSNLITF
jgi:serine/threonine protein kinase